ncbi:MAG: hypothetical protein U9R75_11675 [Candidatus Thermoplasmatota archaeon]|nr:hypothetical protein [Candidatus Thermoplasmatota archaeon]
MKKKRTGKKASKVSFGEVSLVIGTGLFLVGCFMLTTTFLIWDGDTSMMFTWLALGAFCCITPIMFLICLGFGIAGLIFDKKKISAIVGTLLAFMYIALFFASYAQMIKGA